MCSRRGRALVVIVFFTVQDWVEGEHAVNSKKVVMTMTRTEGPAIEGPGDRVDLD